MNKNEAHGDSQGISEISEMHLRFDVQSSLNKDPPNIKRQSVSNVNNFDILASEIRRTRNIGLDSEHKF